MWLLCDFSAHKGVNFFHRNEHSVKSFLGKNSTSDFELFKKEDYTELCTLWRENLLPLQTTTAQQDFRLYIISLCSVHFSNEAFPLKRSKSDVEFAPKIDFTGVTIRQKRLSKKNSKIQWVLEKQILVIRWTGKRSLEGRKISFWMCVAGLKQGFRK